MSEKNRKKSKANKVLKAVGTAGIVFGAATIDRKSTRLNSSHM